MRLIFWHSLFSNLARTRKLWWNLGLETWNDSMLYVFSVFFALMTLRDRQRDKLNCGFKQHTDWWLPGYDCSAFDSSNIGQARSVSPNDRIMFHSKPSGSSSVSCTKFINKNRWCYHCARQRRPSCMGGRIISCTKESQNVSKMSIKQWTIRKKE